MSGERDSLSVVKICRNYAILFGVFFIPLALIFIFISVDFISGLKGVLVLFIGFTICWIIAAFSAVRQRRKLD